MLEEVAPLLCPHVSEQLRGDRGVVGDLVLAVLCLQLAAHVTVQLVVERLHFLPQSLDVGLEVGRGHVVAGAPQAPTSSKPISLAPLLAEIDVADELVLHRGEISCQPFHASVSSAKSCDLARTCSRSSRCMHVGTLGLRLLLHVLEEWRPGRRAVVPLAVLGGHRRLDRRELGSFLGVVGGGDVLGERQQVEASRHVGGERRADGIEAPRPLDGAADVPRRRLFASRREGLGVVCDEVLVDPAGRVALGPQAVEVLLDVVDVRLGLRHRR